MHEKTRLHNCNKMNYRKKLTEMKKEKKWKKSRLRHTLHFRAELYTILDHKKFSLWMHACVRPCAFWACLRPGSIRNTDQNGVSIAHEVTVQILIQPMAMDDGGGRPTAILPHTVIHHEKNRIEHLGET